MSDFLTALALVFVIEGLVLAAVPHRLRWLLEQLSDVPPEALRVAGLVSVAAGLLGVWLIRG